MSTIEAMFQLFSDKDPKEKLSRPEDFLKFFRSKINDTIKNRHCSVASNFLLSCVNFKQNIIQVSHRYLYTKLYFFSIDI